MTEKDYTQKITDILTETEADEVVATFKAIGCDPVERVKQSDGKWTVRLITCPGLVLGLAIV
ncbi:MAG: hypothetical protein WA666_01000 [Nitrospirota bacterium]